MEVLNQGLFETEGFGGRLHQHRNGLETGPSRRPPPALTGDELVLIGRLTAHLTHQDRLKDPELLDGGGEGGHGVLVEIDPGLSGIRRDAADRDLPER